MIARGSGRGVSGRCVSRDLYSLPDLT